MLTLSATAIAEKNALANAGSWLELAEITLPGGTSPILRLASDTQDVYWPIVMQINSPDNLTTSDWENGSPGGPTMAYPVADFNGNQAATSCVFPFDMSGDHKRQQNLNTLVAGTTYTFSAKAKKTSGSTALYFETDIAKGLGVEGCVSSSFTPDGNGWYSLSFSYTPSQNQTGKHICFHSGSATWSICDVTIVPAGTTYHAFPFHREDIDEAAKGSTTALRVLISNVDGSVQSYLESYAGLVGATVRLMLVHSAHLDLTTPEVDQTYEVMAANCDARWATLDLGAASPMGKRFPRARILTNYCRWKFKGTECGYAGATTTCDKTLAACRAMAGGSNSAAFGGFPGAGRGGLHA